MTLHKMTAPSILSAPTPPKTTVTSPSNDYNEECKSHTETDLPTPPPQNHPSPPSSFSNSDLETNPDYIALTSTLSLLLTQRSNACQDLIQLQNLKREALENPEEFLDRLRRTGGTQTIPNIPKMQRIVRAPVVSWKSYGIENVHLDHRLARGLVDRQPVLTPVRLFDDKN